MSHSEEINFAKLEQEFKSAQNAEAKYYRENDAKFRAVHQKVASYEEFRDIVAASHLNPLEKNDHPSADKRNQPWNIFASSASDDVSKVAIPELKSDVSRIDSSDKLTKQWRMLKTGSERCEFLFKLPLLSLERILSIDIPMNFMEEVVATFKDVKDVDRAVQIANIMTLFTKSKRFKLSLQFLSKKDKENLRDVFLVLEVNAVDIAQLKQCFQMS